MFEPQSSDQVSNDSLPSDQPLAKETTDTKENSPKISETGKVLTDQQAHLTDYLLPIEKLETTKRQEYMDKANSWETTQDLDLLRSFGLSIQELNKNPLERHLRLSSLYLKRKPGSDLAFEVDFQNNEMAEWGLDLSDLLPANVLTVDVYDHEGKLIFENAERGMKDGKLCYFESKSGQPAKVQTGFSVKIKETQSGSALTEKAHGAKAYKNALDESIYLTQNAGKTSIKEELRTQAEQQGKKLVMGNDFFDKVLTGVLGIFTAENWQKLHQNGRFDFSGLSSQFKKILEDASYTPTEDQKKVDQQLAEQEKIRKGQSFQKTGPAVEDRNPEANPKFQTLTPEQEAALEPFRRKTIRAARTHLGSTAFRGPDVSGGTLACAKVATTILKDAGALDQVVLNVDASEQALLKKGWRKHLGPPKPGDVIIWGRLPSTIVDGVSKPGHKHIGIMSSETTCIDNNSNVKMPVERKVEFNTNRGLHYLSPPADLSNNA
ncbi:MAG: hypothetical protein ACRCZE_02525 [Candidatus Altimarinota bacterium]